MTMKTLRFLWNPMENHLQSLG